MSHKVQSRISQSHQLLSQALVEGLGECFPTNKSFLTANHGVGQAFESPNFARFILIKGSEIFVLIARERRLGALIYGLTPQNEAAFFVNFFWDFLIGALINRGQFFGHYGLKFGLGYSSKKVRAVMDLDDLLTLIRHEKNCKLASK